MFGHLKRVNDQPKVCVMVDPTHPLIKQLTIPSTFFAIQNKESHITELLCTHYTGNSVHPPTTTLSFWPYNITGSSACARVYLKKNTNTVSTAPSARRPSIYFNERLLLLVLNHYNLPSRGKMERKDQLVSRESISKQRTSAI